MPKLAGHICQCKTCGRSYTLVSVGIQTDSTSDMPSFIDFAEKMFKPGAPFNKSTNESRILMVRPKKLKGDTKDIEEPSSFSDNTLNDSPSITKKAAYEKNSNLKEDTLNATFSESSLIKDFEQIKSQGFGFNTSSAFTEKFIEICDTPKFYSTQHIQGAFNFQGTPHYEGTNSMKNCTNFSKTQTFTNRPTIGRSNYPEEKLFAKTAKNHTSPFNFADFSKKNAKTSKISTASKDLSEDSTNQISENYESIMDKPTFLDPNLRESFKQLVQLEKIGLKQQFSSKNFKLQEKRKQQIAQNESLDLSLSLDMNQLQEFLDN
ncbi:unnamed protein product [Blepharisma stoltei]|uniref:Uncharacterized protein n=1 Tax=Blepharisma stoltei TaxID=1481888 RepID=A0AAU9IWP6_9CILI|nr:unnamed protein product [Blepharisma stoltei]